MLHFVILYEKPSPALSTPDLPIKWPFEIVSHGQKTRFSAYNMTPNFLAPNIDPEETNIPSHLSKEEIRVQLTFLQNSVYKHAFHDIV